MDTRVGGRTLKEQSTAAELARIRRMCQTGVARRIRVGAGASLSEVGQPVGVARLTILKWVRDDR
jgi:hypothetical protein